MAGLALLLVGALAFHQAFLSDLPALPNRDGLWAAGRSPGVTFVDTEGQVIAHRGPRHGQPARLGELPAYVPLAFLAAEDRRFYDHGPVELRAVARAAVANLRAGRTVQGGSTITQQLARTLFLEPEQTLKRKVQEAVIAARLERMLTKDEILELYLNRVYFGDRAYGLSAAARTYFDKSPGELTVSEAALLAALPKAPSRLALTNDLPAAWARAGRILRAMGEIGWLDQSQAYALAMGSPPAVIEAERTIEGDLAWVLDAAAQQASELLGEESPDLVIHLTVDPELQALGAKAVRAAISSEGRRARASQAALVALAPDGAIKVMVGGVEHAQSPFNRAWQARRQPGSAFKTFVWAAAFERGVHRYDVRSDSAIRIGDWRPQNYGGRFRGPVSVDQAFRQSLNTVSVRLAQEAGLENVAELARRFGLRDIPRQPGASIALGAYEVSLLELTSAYQVLQNGGGQVRPYLISLITNARGDVLYQRPPSAPALAYGEFQAAQMVRMMQGVITSGTGRSADIGRPAAGKTGTSQNFRDAWFVGFTPDWAAGVWVGNDDNRPMAGVTGGELPARIWRRFMRAAHEDLPQRGFDWMPPLPQPPPVWSPEPEEPWDFEYAWAEEDEASEQEFEVAIAPPPEDRWERPPPRVWVPSPPPPPRRSAPPPRDDRYAGPADRYGPLPPYDRRPPREPPPRATWPSGVPW